jgi:hypothetical protein
MDTKEGEEEVDMCLGDRETFLMFVSVCLALESWSNFGQGQLCGPIVQTAGILLL